MVNALELQGVRVRYAARSRPALDGVDLEVARGETVAVIGPNGSGKSTLLRAASGLVATEAGEVRVKGVILRELPPLVRAQRIAIVPQGLEAIPPFRVSDFIESGRYAHQRSTRASTRADRDAVDRAITATTLGEFVDRPLESLSGGERQRALVARALAQDTEILLGDEPTASLDPSHQIAVLELFARAARDGRAVLLVTHDLNLASQFADRIALLREGQLVAVGKPAEILRPEVLTAVFGPHLHFSSFAANACSPIVVPQRFEGIDR